MMLRPNDQHHASVEVSDRLHADLAAVGAIVRAPGEQHRCGASPRLPPYLPGSPDWKTDRH